MPFKIHPCRIKKALGKIKNVDDICCSKISVCLLQLLQQKIIILFKSACAFCYALSARANFGSHNKKLFL